MVKFSRFGVGIPPVNEKDDILIDTMIINHILFALGEEFDEEEYNKNNPRNPSQYDLEHSRYVVQTIKERLECGSKLILLDHVQNEIIDVKKRRYKKTYTKSQIEDALKKIGKCDTVTVYEEVMLEDAYCLYHKKTYHKWLTHEPLSLVDCILLKVHVTQGLMDTTSTVSLLTEDRPLQVACESEGRETRGIYGVGTSFSEESELMKKYNDVMHKEKTEEIRKQKEEIRKQTEAEYKEKLMCFCPGCGQKQTRKKECLNCATPLKDLRKKKQDL